MNSYIKAMEIGLANEKDGISYFNLVKEIEDFQGKKKGGLMRKLLSIIGSWIILAE